MLLALAFVTAACRDAGTPKASTTTSAPKTTTATTIPVPVGLQHAVDAAATGREVTVSAAAVNLTSGERGAHLGARVVLSASLYKLFVARELFHRIAAGSLKRDDPSGDGRHSVAECLRLMIVVSDDACGVAGMNMIGKGAMDATLHRDGFPGTYLSSPQRTTANDVAEVLRREWSARSELYALLQQQQVNNRIPPALPPGTPIAHKTGDRTGWAHDAGVITTPRGDLVIVVLTGPWPAPCCHEERIGALERRAFALIGNVARAIYDAAA